MTRTMAVGCVLTAAVLTLWSPPGRRARRRRVLAAVARPEQTVRAPAGAVHRWLPAAVRLPRRGLLGAVVVATVAAVALGGPVAGVAAAAYGALAARAVVRHRARRERSADRTRLLDALGAAAADLRAGLPVTRALPAPGPAQDPLWSRVTAASVVAERTGAPLADVIERIEADARSADRAEAAAAAQLAGARATAWLLAGLPAGGIALGYAIGADPLAVLLHTPVGAACAVGAVALQLAGLAWANRLNRGSPT